MMMARIGLEDARAIVLRPDLHDGDGLRAACDVLDHEGDWLDRSRSHQLRERLDDEAPGGLAGITFDDVAGLILLVGLLLASLWVGYGLDQPMGGAR